ncbi:MAG: Ger(x)C family spore germination protein [Negativicutes bacterium]|nr:Ger(x)C family spore germination protein [Negativicutes bacterium]
MPSHPRLILLLILLSLIVAGCNGSRETDEVAWVITMGLDRASDGDLLVSYRVAVPLVLAAGETAGGGKEKHSSVVVTVKAPTLGEARNLLNYSESRAVNLSHVTAILIGEDLARAGVQDAIGPLTRFREFRGSMFLFVCQGTAKDILARNRPDLEILTSRWVENITHSADETSFFLPTNLHEFYSRLKGDSGSPYAMAIGVNPLLGQGKQAEGPVPGAKAPEYLAGDSPREGGNPVEVVGIGVFKEDKLVGYLGTEETRAVAILSDNYQRGFIAVDDPLLPKHGVNIFFRNGRKPKIEIDLSGENPVINISVYLEGELSAIPTGITYELRDYKTLLEAELSTVIREQIMMMLIHTQSWGTDVVDLGYFIRPKFGTDQQLVAYGWDKRFRQATFHVEVTATIRRTGLMNMTSPIRREQ